MNRRSFLSILALAPALPALAVIPKRKSIPYRGPFLSPASAVAAYEAILARELAGGYDFPSLAPAISDLHIREIVAPEKIAIMVRSSTGDGKLLSELIPRGTSI